MRDLPSRRSFLYEHQGHLIEARLPIDAQLTLQGDAVKLAKDFEESELGLIVVVIGGESYYKILECCEP